jgi:hypothetical protein
VPDTSNPNQAVAKTTLEGFVNEHKNNPDFNNIISALNGVFVNQGNASI